MESDEEKTLIMTAKPQHQHHQLMLIPLSIFLFYPLSRWFFRYRNGIPRSYTKNFTHVPVHFTYSLSLSLQFTYTTAESPSLPRTIPLGFDCC